MKPGDKVKVIHGVYSGHTGKVVSISESPHGPGSRQYIVDVRLDWGLGLKLWKSRLEPLLFDKNA
jgi:hypothetical protein